MGARVEIDGATPLAASPTPSGAGARDRFPTGYKRLRPGPGTPPAQVRANQRDRIHRAMIELAAEAGYEHVTVRALIRTAGVSTRTFYGHFPNREECLAASIDRVGYELLRRAARRTPAQAGWEGRLRAALDSLLGDLAERPPAARLLLIEALAAGRTGRAHATGRTADLERLFARLLAGAQTAAVPPRPLVLGIAAGVVRVATATTLTGRTAELPGLADELGDWVRGVYDERVFALCAASRRRPGKAPREPGPPSEPGALGGHGEAERILSATSRIAAGHGFTALTVSRIRREAGVSRRGFDALFGGVTECFLASVEHLARTAVSRAATRATRPGDDYRIVLALCSLAARNQPYARLVLAAILAPGRDGLLRRERLISAAADRLVETGRPAPRPRPVAAEASIAAAWRIAAEELACGRARRLPEAAPLLAALVAKPFAGRDSG